SGSGTGCSHAVPVLVRDAVDDVLLAFHRAELREPHPATGGAVPPGDLLHRLFARHGRGLPGHVPVAGDLRDRRQTARGGDHVRCRQRLKPAPATHLRKDLTVPTTARTHRKPVPFTPTEPLPAPTAGAVRFPSG